MKISCVFILLSYLLADLTIEAKETEELPHNEIYMPDAIDELPQQVYLQV